MLDFDGAIDVYTTAPQSKESTAERYFAEVSEAARWSDGCAGMLIYSDNSIIDAWLVAQTVLLASKTLRPLVAVQPIYMHPYAAAKMVASLAYLHHRAIALNMIAGGFSNDYPALGDTTPHDDRYARLLEYTQIIQRLLGGDIVTFEGTYYHVHNLRLAPTLPDELLPRILMSGSSPAGRNAAMSVNAIGVEYPKPPGEVSNEDVPSGYTRGIRIGIISRQTDAEARRIAAERFPPNRRGKLLRDFATKVSDSQWHHQLSETKDAGAYTLEPWNYGYCSCPYLIGDHASVAEAIAGYLRLGFQTFILDIPRTEDDVICAGIAFEKALALV